MRGNVVRSVEVGASEAVGVRVGVVTVGVAVSVRVKLRLALDRESVGSLARSVAGAPKLAPVASRLLGRASEVRDEIAVPGRNTARLPSRSMRSARPTGVVVVGRSRRATVRMGVRVAVEIRSRPTPSLIIVLLLPRM